MSEQSILQMKGVRKTFGSVVALNNVTLDVKPKEVLGMLGGNGAGKTTLMNVLYGLYKPDAGQIELDGRPIVIKSPKDAINQGIGMVHQHFLQVENFSIAQNIVLGTPLQNKLTMNLRDAEQKIVALSERFGLHVDPQTIIEDLPMGVRQRVEILKALYRGVKILILDEPTTNLTPQEVDSLFESLRVMVDEGMSVVFITHKLREVLAVCDRISVLREGESVLTLDRHQATEDALVQAMVGEGVDVERSLIFSDEEVAELTPSLADQKPVLQISQLTVLDENNLAAVQNCSLEVYPGEIFGMAGVAGNGQQILAETIVGHWSPSQGQILLDGADLAGLKTVDRLNRQVAYIPEDRLQDGFLPKATVAQNLILGLHKQLPYSKNGFLNWQAITEAAHQLIDEYQIRTLGPEDIGANLSGGNIQRVMIARAFSHPTRLLVAHNPTQGLDIPSMEFVYSKLLERKEQGFSTLLMSENLDELLLLCDRIATIYRGEIVGVLNKSEADKYKLGRLMSGVRDSG